MSGGDGMTKEQMDLVSALKVCGNDGLGGCSLCPEQKTPKCFREIMKRAADELERMYIEEELNGALVRCANCKYYMGYRGVNGAGPCVKRRPLACWNGFCYLGEKMDEDGGNKK